VSDGRKEDQSRRGKTKKSPIADPAEVRNFRREKREEVGRVAVLEQQDVPDVLVETQSALAGTQSSMESGGAKMADNARETMDSVRDTFRQGAEKAKDSMERGADEVTSTLGRMAEISTEYVRRTAEVYLDSFGKMANEVLNLQSKAAELMRGTPLAPLCEAQARVSRKFIDATTNSSRSVLQGEASR
jgi:ElaB/YqjD/DUF883 family membrane-anchored ribosome-binding protein